MKESLYQLSYAGINAKPSGSAVVEGAGFEPAMHGSEPCALPLGDSSIWCPGRDLNPHAFRQLLLRQPCLPVPPPGHKKMWAWSRAAKPAPLCSSRLNRACPQTFHHNLVIVVTRQLQPAQKGFPALLMEAACWEIVPNVSVVCREYSARL